MTIFGIRVKDLHVHGCRRSGIEADGIAGDARQTVTVRNCVVESIDGMGEGASVSCDGIVLLNCTGLVDGCVVRDRNGVGVEAAASINPVNEHACGAEVGWIDFRGDTNAPARFYRVQALRPLAP